MSDFKAKMYQIQFWLGLNPKTRSGAYSAPRDLLAGLRGPTSKGRGGDGKWRGSGGEGTRPHPFTPPKPYFWIRPCEFVVLCMDSDRLSRHRTARQLMGPSIRWHCNREVQSDWRDVLRHLPRYRVEGRAFCLLQRLDSCFSQSFCFFSFYFSKRFPAFISIIKFVKFANLSRNVCYLIICLSVYLSVVARKSDWGVSTVFWCILSIILTENG